MATILHMVTDQKCSDHFDLQFLVPDETKPLLFADGDGTIAAFYVILASCQQSVYLPCSTAHIWSMSSRTQINESVEMRICLICFIACIYEYSVRI